ncbi:YktB family protein [Paenibacillus arenosi]|uniref:UPF0637 protein IFO66_00735 n=1 Tax=Paenibacillus arenosi TaxID=2774142 RepID=A0ABR9AUD6_9BACL|nr:DUF1054 domain-containing protein [Paenibacillus arenosi]MBD8496820.1 DUF1054 domain-containing protein [Paenibacillus arenosi]
MTFNGFESSDFATFHIEGLEQRMEGIRTRIQPKFRAIGEQLVADASVFAGQEMHLHIAKHARRTVNAPKDTWMAIGPNKRGYKSLPHFQVGLFDDHLFIWVAFIYEVENKKQIAERLLAQSDELINALPNHYVLSMDHMKKDAAKITELTDEELQTTLTRFRDIKSSEWLVGLHLKPNDPILQDGQAFIKLASETIHTLMPIYKAANM